MKECYICKMDSHKYRKNKCKLYLCKTCFNNIKCAYCYNNDKNIIYYTHWDNKPGYLCKDCYFR